MKLSFKKIFCFISFIFILSCCIFYGTRFLKLYLENKKVEDIEKNSLVKVIRENNSTNDNFKTINNSEYFINDSENNYLIYSNILFRVIKINNDNSIVAISDSSVSSLAFGKEVNFSNSYINKWLNYNGDEYSGILEMNLNQKENYLVKTLSCLDEVDELTNNDCVTTNEDNYISLLNVSDYINIGNKDSYVVNGEYFYLNNTNGDNGVWYVDENGKITTNKGTDIIGVRPVITIKANIDYINGDGTFNNPYVIESENGLFGSYVKLDEQIWRIYKVNDTEVRLMLDEYLTVNGDNLQYIYSNISSYHDDYKRGSIAYYLNNDFLNTLSYKDKIKEVNWTNGYYGSSSNYDYESALNTTINSKVALISIGDIRLNNKLSNYFTLTGTKKNGSMVYVVNSNQKLYSKNISNKVNVVPVISLDKELLVKGNGSYESPFEIE